MSYILSGKPTTKKLGFWPTTKAYGLHPLSARDRPLQPPPPPGKKIFFKFDFLVFIKNLKMPAVSGFYILLQMTKQANLKDQAVTITFLFFV